MVDIAPEQYQKLRQDFLNGLTVEMLNQDLRQQLSQASGSQAQEAFVRAARGKYKIKVAEDRL